VKRVILAVAILLVTMVALPAFAVSRTVVVVDDVIKMAKAGVGDDEIIAFVKKTPDAFDITGDDVIAMTDAKVSRAVIKFVIDESAARMRADARGTPTRRETTAVYVRPYYDPFYYGSYGYYDPFWYGPRLSLNFGGGYYGGGYYGRGHYGGGHRGRR
jgi:hypothetical protein